MEPNDTAKLSICPTVSRTCVGRLYDLKCRRSDLHTRPCLLHGRITLQTGVPVMTTTQSAKTTIFCTPFRVALLSDIQATLQRIARRSRIRRASKNLQQRHLPSPAA
jgi:hypothetical protein